MPDAGPAAMLDEMLEPVTQAFSRDAAEAIVNVRASQAAQERISDLAQKCNEGPSDCC